MTKEDHGVYICRLHGPFSVPLFLFGMFLMQTYALLLHLEYPLERIIPASLIHPPLDRGHACNAFKHGGEMLT